MASREELHSQCARSFQEKDELRKQIRELGEKADELQLQLFQSEGRLLAAEGRLKQQQLDTLILVGLVSAPSGVVGTERELGGTCPSPKEVRQPWAMPSPSVAWLVPGQVPGPP